MLALSWRVWRGRSSVGRAPQSHCGGQGFKSPRLHQLRRKALKKLNGILDQGLSISLWDTSMVHKQGITPVSNQRLQRRNGVYYYRRRVPLHLVAKFGKKFVQVSLHTNNPKEAKKLRTLRDLEWDAKFAACSSPANGGDGPAVPTTALAQPLSESDLRQLVRDYVARRDQLARKREVTDYPENPAQRAEM